MSSCKEVDPRIKFSIDNNYDPDGELLIFIPNIVFDQKHDRLLIMDSHYKKIRVFSHDGMFIFKTSGENMLVDQDAYPWGLAIDYDNDRVFVTGGSLLQSWSPLSTLEHKNLCINLGSSIRDIVIDNHNQHIIIADSAYRTLHVISLKDFSPLFTIGTYGTEPGKFTGLQWLAIDHDRQRIIVPDHSGNNRIQVFSSMDGSFLFQFRYPEDPANKFSIHSGICVDNQGRIIIADISNYKLQAFTADGHFISHFDCVNVPCAVAFDKNRGTIAFSTKRQINVIEANQWLPGTFIWRPNFHYYAPLFIKQVVIMITMLRSFGSDCLYPTIILLPNELLFLIFSFL